MTAQIIRWEKIVADYFVLDLFSSRETLPEFLEGSDED